MSAIHIGTLLALIACIALTVAYVVIAASLSLRFRRGQKSPPGKHGR
jgi:hypothetical protein